MSYESFLLIFYSNLDLFIITWIITVSLYFLIFKRYIYSIIDPLFFHTILSSSGFSIIISLYKLGYIDSYYLYDFLITQTFFILGFYIFKPIIKVRKVQNLMYDLNPINISIFHKTLYVISGLTFIVTNYALYALKGIPLLMESRLEVGIGGYGIFLATLDVTITIMLAFISLKIFVLKKKLNSIDFFFLANILIYIILSGSRSGILKFLFITFYILLFIYVKRQILLKISKLNFIFLISFAIFLSTFLFYLTTKQNPLFSLLFRILMTGDIYMMAYVNDNINIIEGNFFSHIMGPVLAGFKIIPWDEVPKSIGQQLFNHIYQTDLPAGPNARMNIIALKFFGDFSFLYSFMIGLGISFIRNRSIYMFKDDSLGLLMYLFLSLPALSLETDIVYAINLYKNYFTIGFLLIFISLIISTAFKRSKKYGKETKNLWSNSYLQS